MLNFDSSLVSCFILSSSRICVLITVFCPSLCMSICLSVCMPVHLSVYLHAYLPVFLSVCVIVAFSSLSNAGMSTGAESLGGQCH